MATVRRALGAPQATLEEELVHDRHRILGGFAGEAICASLDAAMQKALRADVPMSEGGRTPARLLLTVACVATALTGLGLATACVVRLAFWPPTELGGLFLFWLDAVAVPAQLVPMLGVLWAILLWRGRPIRPVVWVGLAMWALLSVAVFALGLLGLLIHD